MTMSVRPQKRQRLNATEDEVAVEIENVEMKAGAECALLFVRWLRYKSERAEKYTKSGVHAQGLRMIAWWNDGFDLDYAITLAMSKDWMGWEFDHSRRRRAKIDS